MLIIIVLQNTRNYWLTRTLVLPAHAMCFGVCIIVAMQWCVSSWPRQPGKHPALLWFCTDQESFINICGQKLFFLTWRIWHGGVFLHSTALTWDQTEDCALLKTKQGSWGKVWTCMLCISLYDLMKKTCDDVSISALANRSAVNGFSP